MRMPGKPSIRAFDGYAVRDIRCLVSAYYKSIIGYCVERDILMGSETNHIQNMDKFEISRCYFIAYVLYG